MKPWAGIVFASLLATTLALPVCHAGDPARGKAAARRCAGCHGVTGIASAPNYPNLAGQKEAYLIKAIKDYRSGSRKDPVMASMVATLSEEDIAHIAAYYSSQPSN